VKNLLSVFFILSLPFQVFASDIETRNKHGETALIRAASDGNFQETKKLLQGGAQINAKDQQGNTALFFAVGEGFLPIVQLLIKSGADLTLVYGEKKESILFEAAGSGNVAIALVLVKTDKSLVGLVNSENETPLFEAVRNDSAKMTAALLKAGVSRETKNKHGETALSLAEKGNFAKIVNVLKSK
jgi:ankyrin repeat protein